MAISTELAKQISESIMGGKQFIPPSDWYFGLSKIEPVNGVLLNNSEPIDETGYQRIHLPNTQNTSGSGTFTVAETPDEDGTGLIAKITNANRLEMPEIIAGDEPEVRCFFLSKASENSNTGSDKSVSLWGRFTTPKRLYINSTLIIEAGALSFELFNNSTSISVTFGYLHNGNFYLDESYSQLVLPESEKIYIDNTTQDAYFWDGNKYVPTSNPVEIDNTLSIEGAAAESSTVGSKLESIESAIADLSYIQIAIENISVTNNKNEIGSTVTSTNITWSLNKEPSLQTIKIGDSLAENVQNSIREKEYTELSIKERTNIILTATDERDYTVTKQATIDFLPKVYWGISSDPSNLTSNVINSLNNALTNTKTRTFTVNASNDNYIVYVIPSSFGEAIFSVGGFDGGFKKIKTINHLNSSNYTQNYDIYQSINPNLGNVTVTVK